MALFSSKISTKEMVPLCRQLATSYDAGIPILKGLQLVERSASSSAAKSVLLEMRTSIEAGATLADAARAQGDRLPPLFVELLSSGERGGKLDVMFRDVADYYEDRLRLNREIAGAMAYPIFLMVATWFIGSFAIGIISNLSLDPRSQFSIAEYVDAWLRFQGISLLVAAVALALLWAASKTGVPQRLWGQVSTFLWPFSQITRKFALARFCRSFSLLIGAGVDIRHSLVSAANTAVNTYVRDDLLRALPVISQGGSLQEAFSRCRSLTPTVREMIAVGEESGNLEFQLRKAAQYHAEEAQLATRIALRFLNIMLILIVGGVVGATIIGFYSKLFSLYDSI
jgi:type IV pilus assembly protein PilC